MKKKAIYIFILLAFSCRNKTQQENFIKIEGNTQGTTYHINYSEKNAITYEKQIDSLLKVIDNSLSMYIDSSILSAFNSSDTGSRIDEHILKVFWKSCEIHHYSGGAFDPTVKPLIDFWGFGTDKINVMAQIDKNQVDSILRFVGLEKVKLYEKTMDTIYEYLSDKEFPDGEYYLLKNNPAVQLDFNAIAQGYTVDLIAGFLEKKGVENYMVEIGGELRVKGKNSRGELWKIGIDKPIDESKLERPLQAVVTLKNKAIATSGNYRKFFVKEGVKYSHTIDTRTGFPVQQKTAILSATVLTDDCMSADGYATALMALGLEKAKELIYSSDYLEAYIIYDENGEWKSFLTEKMKTIVEEKKE